MVNKLYALCLLVDDLEKSLVFYRDTLGLVVNSTDDGYVDFKLGETSMLFFRMIKPHQCLIAGT
jgi:catechol 2,3-dioxygenase-like lactoylglutathione lyase family enzyme